MSRGGVSGRLQEAILSTRVARARLDPGTYWRGIDPDVHLGYRRAPRGGRWLVRWRVERRYQQAVLGTADDALDADGVNTFSFTQATVRARNHIAAARVETVAKAAGPALTVRSAVLEYIEERSAAEDARTAGIGLKRDHRSRLQKHVLPNENLADLGLHKLTASKLAAWRDGLPATLSPSTRKRITSDLRAALNRAARYYRERLPVSFEREVRAGLVVASTGEPVARDLQVLADDEVRSIIKAAKAVDEAGGWDGALHRLVLVMAATGARFSQLARMVVADAQLSQNRLMVPTSRKGRGVKLLTRTPVPIGADVVAALRTAVAGRKGVEPLLVRPQWERSGRLKWTKAGTGRWKAADELLRVWGAIVTEAGLSADVVPYALRHSSIVRGLRFNLPTRLVAASHDTSVAMVEKHYAAFITSALEELTAKAIIPLS